VVNEAAERSRRGAKCPSVDIGQSPPLGLYGEITIQMGERVPSVVAGGEFQLLPKGGAPHG